MACALCQTRRPRRFCPGVSGEICPICCGNEREVSIACPLDCEYLRAARQHDKPLPVDPETLPNRDISVTEQFLQANEELLICLGQSLGETARRTPGVVDTDVREALDATIQTFRTLQSGLYYESLPANPLAAMLCRALLAAADEFRQAETENLAAHKTADSTILGCLVFLQHFEISFHNGRRRGRAFLSALREYYPPLPDDEPPASSSLILP